MSHTFHQLYYHFIWATHSREPLIAREWRPELLNIINDEVKLRGGIPLRHNAMPDHVHLVARLSPTVLISDFVGKVTEVQASVAGGIWRSRLDSLGRENCNG